MFKAIGLFLAINLCCASAFATPASDSSIRQLFEVMETKSLIENSQAQLEQIVNKGIDERTAKITPNKRQMDLIAKLKSDLRTISNQELSWERLEPLMLRLYGEIMSEEEIVALTEFYKMPLGQIVIKKLPQVMQRVVIETQENAKRLAPKLQAVFDAFDAEMAKAR